VQFFRLLKYAGKYKKYLILCPIVMIGEVVMEMLLPTITADLIDKVIPESAETGNILKVLLYGGVMLVMALISMLFGMAGSRFAAKGGMGFSRNLRQAIFEKVQKYSFKNIDKFSTASLVTRLTTDVNQTQNVVMMLVRMAVRSPIMMVMAMVMAFRMNSSLMPILAVSVPILLIAIVVIMSKAFPRFQIMMKKYDALNASVVCLEECCITLAVVETFVPVVIEGSGIIFQQIGDDVHVVAPCGGVSAFVFQIVSVACRDFVVLVIVILA